MSYLFMLVDDNEGDHFLNENVISNFDKNIEMIKAYDGQDALNILSKLKKQPDVIFLDLNMPGMDGFEFLRKYNEIANTETSIFILSSSTHEKDKARTLKYSNVVAHSSKPLRTEDLQVLLLGEALEM